VSQLKFFKINQMVSLFIVLASTSGCGLFTKDYVATSSILVTGYSFDGAYRTFPVVFHLKTTSVPQFFALCLILGRIRPVKSILKLRASGK